MWTQQIFVAFLCIFIASQQITAVVNNGKSTKAEETSKTSSATVENTKTGSSTNASVTDSVAESSEDKANRREAPLETYGAPVAAVSADTYLPPSGASNVNLPVPVYGVPDAPSNNIVYPAPPPDIPPPVVSVQSLPAVSIPSGSYGLPVDKPKEIYGVPSFNFGGSGLSLNSHISTPPIRYGVPHLSPPKSFFPGPVRGSNYKPKPLYGLPSRPIYGPPKSHFSKFTTKYKTHFNHRPSKPINTYGPPHGASIPFKDNFKSSKFNLNLNSNFLSNSFGHSAHGSIGGISSIGGGISSVGGGHSISTQYGAPEAILSQPAAHYGPPQPSPHPKPPHPGAPAPPTPPDIKYDGWQPIPGLVSKPPSDSYGVPPAEYHASGDLSFNSDLLPPPISTGISHGPSHHESSSHGNSHIGTSHLALSNNYGIPQGPVSDSYAAPLNTVTGSGGVVISSGDAHREVQQHSTDALSLGLTAAGISGDTSLQTIKSIGYELFPNNAGAAVSTSAEGAGHGLDITTINLGQTGGSAHGGDLQITDTYSAPPLNSYSPTGPYAAAHSYKSNGFSSGSFGSFGSSHGSSGYKGLSLSSSGIGLIPPSGVYGAPSGHYGTPLFTPHSSHGQSFGKHRGFQSHSSYLPPPSTYLKPVKEEAPPEPSNLYSLPHADSAISFQNVVHGSSNAGLSTASLASGSADLHLGGGHAQALSSYNAPLGTIDGSYSLVQNTAGLSVGLDHSLPPVSIDLTGGYSQSQNNYLASSYAIPHDCSLHKSQPLPSLSFGVPSANSYTAALSSLTTNIAGAQALPQTYGVPDLHGAHSHKITNQARANSNQIESNDKDAHGKVYGKSVAESFGPNSELVESQSLDFKNIPVQGALGSYTLQIQSADGQVNGQVPHQQVLNDGLLQSILAAIEQPQQGALVGQQTLQLPQSISQSFITGNNNPVAIQQTVLDAQAEHSSPAKFVTSTSEDATQSEQDDSLKLIDDNQIALYFSNNQQRHKKDTEVNTKSTEENKEVKVDAEKVKEKEVKNSH